MKIDFDVALLQFDGSEIKTETKPPETLKLKDVCIVSLSALGDGPEPPEEKAKKFNLMVRISKGGVIDIGAQDVARIDNCVARVYPNMVYGQVNNLIEGRKHFDLKDQAD